MANNPNAGKNLKHFAKGHDPRRNVTGRPRTFKAFRECVLDFLNTPTTRNKTRLDALMLQMTHTQQGRRVLLEYAFGRVPQPITGAGEGPVQIEGFEEMLRKVYGPLHK